MTINAGDTGWVTFAISAGDNLADLRTHIDSAQAKALRLGWTVTPPVAVGDGKDVLPTTFALEQNYPNPFNPTTTIRFNLPTRANVSLSIYNVLGQKVITLTQGELSAGYFSVEWNGRNEVGAQVASGLYFYRIEAKPKDGAETFVQIKKMLLLK